MKINWILPFVLVLTGAPTALAQRGRGMGAPGRHDAPTGVSNPAPRGQASSSAPNGSSRAATHNATVASRVEANPALASRIQPLLPTGMTVQSATSGFKNEGQFLAALHVSHNLNIPFAQIKSKMTGSNPVSLGKAIHDLRPDLDKGSVKKLVKTAEKQSDHDLGS